MGIIKIPAAGRTDTDAVAALGQPAMASTTPSVMLTTG